MLYKQAGHFFYKIKSTYIKNKTFQTHGQNSKPTKKIIFGLNCRQVTKVYLSEINIKHLKLQFPNTRK